MRTKAEADVLKYKSEAEIASKELTEMRTKYDEFKQQYDKMANMVDPNTQLVKSVSTMIKSLQADLEQKRKDDSELISVLIDGQKR